MKSTLLPFLWPRVFSVTILLALSVTSVPATRINIPKRSPISKTTLRRPEISPSPAPFPDDPKTFYYYNQTLDHFNYGPESYATFKQRYVVDSEYWAGPNAPILAYLGNEDIFDGDLGTIMFLNQNAKGFKALQVFMEHRFYGKSIPFNLSTEEVMKNASLRGYFNSAQALADYAEILLHIKEEFHAQHSPVIVVGRSYGGMLATWFRLKYPHIAIGALASSAPILYFDGIPLNPPGGYNSVVSNVIRGTSETCYQTLRDSWAAIDSVAAKLNGLAILSEKFQSCQPLTNASMLTEYLLETYREMTQGDSPDQNFVITFCGGIDGANSTHDDVFTKIYAGLIAVFDTASDTLSECLDIEPEQGDPNWSWQTCTEMVFPFEFRNDTMFPYKPFDLKSYEADCKSKYGVVPRPHWITSYYGGHDIKLILQRFGSNIIFSNGLKDPWSSGGVLEDLSDSLIALVTENGTHCLDQTSSGGPKWLSQQQINETKITRQWLDTYFADLKALIEK